MAAYFDDRVALATSADEALLLREAASRIQARLHARRRYPLRIASIYHYYLHALDEQQTAEALSGPAEPTIPVESSLYRTCRGDILSRLLEGALFREAIDLGVIPCGPHRINGRSRFVVGVADRAGVERATQAVGDWYRVPRDAIECRIVPDLCAVNFWDTLRWLLLLGGLRDDFPDLTSEYPFGVQARDSGKVRMFQPGSGELARLFSRELAREALSLGSTRLAGRLLRILQMLFNRTPVDLLPEGLDTARYERLVQNLAVLVSGAAERVRPVIPALLPLYVWTEHIREENQGNIAAHLVDLGRVVDKTLRMIRADIRHVGEILGRIAPGHPLVVFGVASMALSGRLLWLLALRRVPKITFVRLGENQRPSAFKLTSAEFAENACAINPEGTTVCDVRTFLGETAVGEDSIVLVGAAHLRGADLVAENGTSLIVGHSFPASAYGMIGKGNSRFLPPRMI